jgi:hypothetical protein
MERDYLDIYFPREKIYFQRRSKIRSQSDLRHSVLFQRNRVLNRLMIFSKFSFKTCGSWLSEVFGSFFFFGPLPFFLKHFGLRPVTSGSSFLFGDTTRSFMASEERLFFFFFVDLGLVSDKSVSESDDCEDSGFFLFLR